MAGDRTVGALILAGSILGIIIYAGLLLFFSLIVLQITAFVGVAVLLGILAWIGWTMATTPPPEPITDIKTGVTDSATATNQSASTHESKQ